MKKACKNIPWQALVYGLMFLLAGCLPAQSNPAILPTGEAVFKAPTQPAAETPAGSAALPVNTQPAPPCQNGLAFLSDVTIPDRTTVAPGAVIDKVWEVENIGTCSWDAGYSIRHVGGSNLGAETSQPLYPARAGTRANISIRFTAPAESGTIHSAWRAYGPDGQPFGDAVYVQIIVSSDAP